MKRPYAAVLALTLLFTATFAGCRPGESGASAAATDTAAGLETARPSASAGATNPTAGRPTFWQAAGSAVESAGTQSRSVSNRLELAEQYDVHTERQLIQEGDLYYLNIVSVAALEGLECQDAVWTWIHAARRELSAYSGYVDENADIYLGYLCIYLSAWDYDTEYVEGEGWYQLVPLAVRTAVFDLETGRRVTLADLFYEDVNYIEAINSRIRDTADLEGFKRSFAGFTADYPYFGLIYNAYKDNAQLILYCDKTNPYYLYDALYVDLALGDSPFGRYYYDVSYERMEGAGDKALMIPTVRLNGGVMPATDKAINDAVQAMIPTLKKAKLVFYPYLFLEEGYFGVVFLERDYIMYGGGDYLTAAVPGCVIYCDLSTGEPFSMKDRIPARYKCEYYELTGGTDPYIAGENEYMSEQQQSYGAVPMKNYDPPRGGVLSDYIRLYGYYAATLTEPSSRRILVRYCEVQTEE